VVTLNDDLQLIAHEIVRNDFQKRVNIGLDFFDASINRIGAYVIGTRATLKAFLIALLEPTQLLLEFEEKQMYFERLAFLEEQKTMPIGAVWAYYLLKSGVPVGHDYVQEIQQYEKDVLSKR
jgi:L-rhamnose isomerase